MVTTEKTLTLTSQSPSLNVQLLPTLPFDLIPEILCWLPVIFLLRFRSVCKSWNSLISSDLKFAKKQHFCMSTTRRLHFVSHASYSNKYTFTSYPIDFLNIRIRKRKRKRKRKERIKATNLNLTRFEYFSTGGNYAMASSDHFVGSCNGIICIANHYTGLVILCNPSIRTIKELPLFEKPSKVYSNNMTFGFGYDSFRDTYKVVVGLRYQIQDSNGNYIHKIEVKVHTLDTNIWKSIQDFPYGVGPIDLQPGKFVSSAINWLCSDEIQLRNPSFIVSYDLGKESYQKILPPNYGGVDVCKLWTLDVLRDCLCATSGDNVWAMKDVWIMKEYGNVGSWIKLYTIDSSKYHIEAVHIFENDQVLVKICPHSKIFVYNSRNCTFKCGNFERIPEICVESLISSCF
ncbi:F-box and associated interaction domain protein [Medicago truncatula]|uniref:F-box and associated interaction domain protein n=3 Tax=Medicago truncatula TaxID=3880 RepID=G7K9A3_MEDTR|nr:F-box and associated interaction domain protein [Medicago truncatula]